MSHTKASNGQQFPCPASLYRPRSSFGKQGSGPNRGQSPVEWGDFPYVCPYVRPYVRLSVRPPLWAIQPGLRPSQPVLRPSQPGLRSSQPAKSQASGMAGLASDLAGWASGLAGWRRGGGTDGRMDKRTDGRKISPFYRTLSPIGAAAQKSPHSTGLCLLLEPLPKNGRPMFVT